MRLTAQVRQRRTTPNGTRSVNVVCPVCDRRHWVRDGATGKCPRKTGAFTIHDPKASK